MTLKFKQFIDNYIGGAIVFVNLIVVRLLGLVLNRNHAISQPPQHILVIKILGLGSLIMASDSLYSLKRKYPQAKFILLCGRSVKPGIEPLQLFDEIWVCDDRSFLKLVYSSLKALIKSIRLKKLWVLDLEVYSILTTIFSAWTCAINRFGFQLEKVHFRVYLNTHNTYFNQFVKVEQNYQALVRSMGVEEIQAFSFPGFDDRALTKEYTQQYIAVNNTCSDLGGHLRKIPEPIYRDMCRYIVEKTSYYIAFTGAPSDKVPIDEFIRHASLPLERIRNIAGEMTFGEYYSFLHNECSFMISIDSAPLHIANKIGLPTLSLWGPVNPFQRVNERGDKRHLTYYLGKECSPCIHHTEDIPCKGNNICMKDMDVKHIQSMIDTMIKTLQQA